MADGGRSAAKFTIWTSAVSASRTAKAAGKATVRIPPTGIGGRTPKSGGRHGPLTRIEKERELEKGQDAPAAFGRYQNVFLSAGELSELQADFPAVWQEYIERLSEYIASTGKTYKNHAATIRRWAAEDKRRGKSLPDYPYKEGESL